MLATGIITRSTLVQMMLDARQTVQFQNSNPAKVTLCNFIIRIQKRPHSAISDFECSVECSVESLSRAITHTTDIVTQPRRIAIILHYRIPPHVRLYSICGSAIWLAKHNVNSLRRGVNSEPCVPIFVDTLIQSGSYMQIAHFSLIKKDILYCTQI